ESGAAVPRMTCSVSDAFLRWFLVYQACRGTYRIHEWMSAFQFVQDNAGSPRNTAAFRRANSANVVGSIPNILCASRQIRDLEHFNRSLVCSSRASAKEAESPVVNRACLLSSGVTFT